MGMTLDKSRFPLAKRRLHDAAYDLIERGTKAGRDVAKVEAPVDLGALVAGIVAVTHAGGAYILSPLFYSAWVEYGTGIYGEAETAPHRKTKWTYLHPRFGWVTTRGYPPQRFMRPGYHAGKRYILVVGKQEWPG